MDTFFQFSGGKDSLVCLELLRPQWDRLTVVWMNTGAAYPETIEQMEGVRATVPNFLEVRANVLEDVARNGAPVDVLPMSATLVGRFGSGTPTLQTWGNCCLRNRWRPLALAMKERGAKIIIRGQRGDEEQKGPLRDGDVIDGILYRFPLQNWTAAQVDAYLLEHGIKVPEIYSYAGKSLDCWNCTASPAIYPGQLRYLKERYPDKHAYVLGTLRQVKTAITEALQPLNEALQ